MLVLALSVAIAAAQVPDAFEGTWTNSDTSPVDAAIEEVVQAMPFWKRPFARARLREVTTPCVRLVVAELDGALSIACDDRPPAVQVPGTGTVTYIDEDGDRYGLSMEVLGDRIVQVFSDPRGARTNTYRVEDGQLVLDVVVASAQLPEDLTYTRTFRRQ